MNKTFLLLLVLLIISCSSKKNLISYDDSISPGLKNYFEVMYAISNKDSLLSVDPLNYLEALSTEDLDFGTDKQKVIQSVSFHYFITNEWIDEEDVVRLMPLIYDKQLSSQPRFNASSSMPRENSTKGIEAMHLIEIFRDTTFSYPSLSRRNKIGFQDEQDEKADALSQWWKDYLDK